MNVSKEALREQAVHNVIIKEMFAQRKTDEEIGAAIGRKSRTVQERRIALGLTRPGNNAPKLDEAWLRYQFAEHVAGYYKAGDVETVRRKIRQLASDAGVVHETIRRRLIAAGLIDRDFSRMAHPKDRWTFAEKLLKDDGLPYAEVARQTGISTTSLNKKLPGLGVRPEDFSEFRQANQLARKLGL